MRSTLASARLRWLHANLAENGKRGSFRRSRSRNHILRSWWEADLASEGFDQVIVIMPNVTDLECFDLLASRIIPVVERIAVAGREPSFG